MSDTVVSLLRTILLEEIDHCTCDATRDRCLHCRIAALLEVEEEAAAAIAGVMVERELVEALMDNASMEKLARYCVYLNGRIDQLHKMREQFESAVIKELHELKNYK